MWPFEVEIDHESGSREYHQHARDNQDGTVTVCELHLPEGYVERTYPGRTEPRFASDPGRKPRNGTNCTSRFMAIAHEARVSETIMC